MRISLIPQLICCTALITPPVMLPTRAAMPPTIHFLTTFHWFACLSASFLITQFCLLSNFYQHSAPTSIFAHTCIPICWLPLTLCPPNTLGYHHPSSTCFHLIIIDHLQPCYLSYTHSTVAWGILCLCVHLCMSPLPTPPSHSLLTTINNLFTHGWGAVKNLSFCPFCPGPGPILVFSQLMSAFFSFTCGWEAVKHPFCLGSVPYSVLCQPRSWCPNFFSSILE